MSPRLPGPLECFVGRLYCAIGIHSTKPKYLLIDGKRFDSIGIHVSMVCKRCGSIRAVHHIESKSFHEHFEMAQ